jgi:hypothetical protein
MSDFLEKWQAAKRTFENTTKAKKPSTYLLGIFRQGTGIEKALTVVDTALPNAHKSEKDLAAFEKAVKSFVATKNTYLKTLEAAAAKEATGADAVTYQKGITVLKTELKALETSLAARVGVAKSALAKEDTFTLMAKNLMKMADGACDRALAFVATVKANPTPAEFNAGIVKATRDITQQIGNIDKLTAKGFKFDKPQPTNLFTILTAWADKGRRVKDTATSAEVLREVGALEQAVKGVKRWLE